MTMKRAERVVVICNIANKIADNIEKMETVNPDLSIEILNKEGVAQSLLGEILEGAGLVPHMGTKPVMVPETAIAEALCLEVEQVPPQVKEPWVNMRSLARALDGNTPINKVELVSAIRLFATNLKSTKFNSGKRGRPPLVFTAGLNKSIDKK